MKFAPLILLLLVACGAQVQTPSAPQAVQAPAASQVGHINPIQLPDNEVVHGFVACGGPGFRDRYIVTKTIKTVQVVYTLRDENGSPIIIVKDGRLN